jgi:hypothetical protein
MKPPLSRILGSDPKANEELPFEPTAQNDLLSPRIIRICRFEILKEDLDYSTK